MTCRLLSFSPPPPPSVGLILPRGVWRRRAPGGKRAWEVGPGLPLVAPADVVLLCGLHRAAANL